MVVATYQAASGIGKRGIDELLASTRAYLDGQEPAPAVFERPLAFNVLPKIGGMSDHAFTDEELKMDRETRKIFGEPDLEIMATCVRVPTLRAHAAAVTAFFKEEVDPAEARSLLERAPGVIVNDDPAAGSYPTPRDAAGGDDVLVGRVRRVPFDKKGLTFFCAGDQIRKGAALNAVQIAERLIGA
jgi:aspartate-semialdehyde dehydrogenase